MMDFLKQHWGKLAAGVAGAMVLGYIGLGLLIGSGVREAVELAQAGYPGDPVPALMALAGDDGQPLEKRNRAIWALGQLGDEDALPLLQSLRMDVPCDHENQVCQKEVKKALEGCSGGTNLGAWIWRYDDLAQGP